MSFFYEPVNLKQWDMFQKVKSAGHIETFLATKEVQPGDIMLLHVGTQDKRYQSGIYAVGIVRTEQYILENSPEEYCNHKNSVDVEIIAIDYEKPYLTHEQFSQFCKQFRCVHKIDPKYSKALDEILRKNCIPFCKI